MDLRYPPPYYQPASFADRNRYNKIKQTLPEVDLLYKKYAEKHNLPGYSYAVLVDGDPVALRCSGYSHVSKKTLITPKSVFRLASITKSFTAMAVLKLRDERKLRLDDPLTLYFDALRGQKLTLDAPEITIRDLLSHNAGLPEDNAWGDRKLNLRSQDLILLLKKGLHFSTTSGTCYEYSNLGYAILGLIVGQVSGISCQEYIAKNIWDPLGMVSATWDYKTVSSDHLVRGYKLIKERWHEEEMLEDGSFAPMGGSLASIEDLCKYVAFHQHAWPSRNDPDDQIIRRSSLREMQQPHVISDQPSKIIEGVSGYGYGLQWNQGLDFVKYVSHSGGLPGFGCNWIMLPDYGLAVVFLANKTYVPAVLANVEALKMMMKQATLQPRVFPASLVLQERQKQLVNLLPSWKEEDMIGCFSSNFFLDNDREMLRKRCQTLWTEAGKILHVGPVVAENQLRGYFLLKGEALTLKARFTLAPEDPALIQALEIESTGLRH